MTSAAINKTITPSNLTSLRKRLDFVSHILQPSTSMHSFLKKLTKRLTHLCAASLACNSIGLTSDWNQFRGPNGSGVATESHPPIHIDAQKPTWKTPIPDGHSSPIVAGNLLVITVQSGKQVGTLALDTQSGNIEWQKDADISQLEKVHAANTPVSSTPVSDGKHIYVYFGSFGLFCYDLEGSLIWKKAISPPQTLYGISTSPILFEQRLFVVLDDDRNLPDSQLSRSRVVAYDKSNGKVLWETPRPYNRSSWSTPMIWTKDQQHDLVVMGNGRIYGYDARLGHEKWFFNGFTRETIAVPIAGNGKLYASASMRGGGGDLKLDPEPFWKAALHFDTNGDQQISKNEISAHFTIPLRPELPVEHPGFGIPLPAKPEARRQRQIQFFNWRDKNKDNVWTRDEFIADMKVGSGRPLLAAILPGGSGDITQTHRAWESRRGIPEIPSPVYHDKRIYLVRAGGLISCVNSENGALIYRERLNAPGQYAASPVIADQHLYCVSQQGMISVVQLGDSFAVTSKSNLKAIVNATPAIDKTTLYVRTKKSLQAFR
jgi:outer membrane protein assembly factor BamB